MIVSQSLCAVWINCIQSAVNPYNIPTSLTLYLCSHPIWLHNEHRGEITVISDLSIGPPATANSYSSLYVSCRLCALMLTAHCKFCFICHLLAIFGGTQKHVCLPFEQLEISDNPKASVTNLCACTVVWQILQCNGFQYHH